MKVGDDTPSSGCFQLKNGTELQINCEQSNKLDLYWSIFGMLEHMDEIDNAGF
jgi:hypothetical protein